MPKGEVGMENVSFRCQPDVSLIENRNVTVRPGRWWRLGRWWPWWGRGAGETTLVNLLLRFYNGDEGRSVGQETYEELPAKDGFYAELYNSQLAGARVASAN
ncbi:MAG: hypothetical protein FWJ73_08335 [Limnochordales bacterium]|nr:hypothetical protein [Bacillota bacterium]